MRFPEAHCACGESLLFGPLASEEDRAAPMCSACERVTEIAFAKLADIARDSEDVDLVSHDPLVTDA